MVVLAVFSLTLSCVVVVSALGGCLWLRARDRMFAARVVHRAAVAEKALRDQGMLANAVAHELKNPITAIVCAAQTFELLLDTSLDAGQRSALRHIKEHGEYVLSLMGDFIDVTRGVTGQLSSQKENVAVGGPIRAVVGMLGGIAAQKKVDIEIRGCDDVSSIVVDPKHLKQIIFNLAHNAVKFSPRGGKVVITATQNYECPSQSVITLSVRDHGAGIEPSRLRSIFNATENFKVARTENSGCGLGLHITKTLVDVEGGELRVCSNWGDGTEVSVVFPAVCVSDRVVSQPLEASPHASPLAGQKVLVVEDDPELRESVSGLIRALGGVADGVGEAVQALEAVQRSHYSTVVIDEYIGGLSADEVAQMIKSQPGAQQARFVVTGGEDSEAVVKRNPATRRTLEKPFDARTLVASLLERD